MFDRLQDKFSKIFSSIKGHGKISEKNIVNKSKRWVYLINKIKLYAHKKHNQAVYYA